jgi:hypothetical protein
LAPSQAGNKTFSLTQVPNPQYHGPDGPSDLILAHAKHGKVLPQKLKTAIQTNPTLNNKFSALLKSESILGPGDDGKHPLC